MKGKLNNILSKKIFYVILEIIIVGVVEIVYASNLINSKNVSYSNETSKLNSNNVQGAIDELYNNCKDVKNECPDRNICRKVNTFRDLKSLEVTSGDGLYQDETEPNKFFYRGKSPNNYVKFNNELWRILSINQDGTVKIVKDGYYSTSMAWDTSGNNDWTRPASLNTELNSTYYNSLSTTAKDMINTSPWDIGGTGWVDKQTIVQDVETEKVTTWIGKIALFTVSEYIRTNSNIACHTGPVDYFRGDNGNPGINICNNTTWLYDSNHNQRSLTRYSKNENLIWAVYENGTINTAGVADFHAIRPVLNLKSSISIVSGSGKSSDPFIIK